MFTNAYANIRLSEKLSFAADRATAKVGSASNSILNHSTNWMNGIDRVLDLLAKEFTPAH